MLAIEPQPSSDCLVGFLFPVGKNHGQISRGRHSSLPQLFSLPPPTMGVVSRLSGAVQDDPGAHPKPVSHAPAFADSVATSGIPDSDKYVDKLLRSADPLPPISWSNWYNEIRWFNLSVIVITPLVALYGALTSRLESRTFWFCVFYYVFNMIGGCPACFGEKFPRLIALGIFRNHGGCVPPTLCF